MTRILLGTLFAGFVTGLTIATAILSLGNVKMLLAFLAGLAIANAGRIVKRIIMGKVPA